MFFETILNGFLGLLGCLNAILWIIALFGCGLVCIFIIMYALGGEK